MVVKVTLFFLSLFALELFVTAAEVQDLSVPDMFRWLGNHPGWCFFMMFTAAPVVAGAIALRAAQRPVGDKQGG